VNQVASDKSHAYNDQSTHKRNTGLTDIFIENRC